MFRKQLKHSSDESCYVCSFIKRARPIQKLCEFEGNLPDEYEPDCYKDVDESDYACKEKYRIMVSKHITN